jgi:hypothetical protein
MTCFVMLALLTAGVYSVCCADGSQDATARCLLRGAAFQLRDRHDNAVSAAGIPVRLALTPVTDSAVAGEAPAIEAASAGEALQTKTDDGGRVYWDEIAVVQGSGAGCSKFFLTSIPPVKSQAG